MRLIRLSQNQIALIFKCIALAVTKIWSSNLIVNVSVSRTCHILVSLNESGENICDDVT